MPRLLSVARESVRTLSRAMESSLGISGPLRLVLRVAAQRPGIGAGELADILHLDASTLTGHLTRLEELGLIERRASASDGRRVHVHVTPPRGKRFDVRTPGTIEAAVDAALDDDKEVAIVEGFLLRLVTALDEQRAACQAPKPRRRRAR